MVWRLGRSQGRVRAAAVAIVVVSMLGSSGACRRTGQGGGVPENRSADIFELRVDLDPPGAVRGGPYRGTVFVRDPGRAEAFEGARAVQVRAVDTSAVRHIRAAKKSPSELSLELDVSENARSTERLELWVDFADRRANGVLFLRVVDKDWDPSWRPVALAPPDTVVSGSESIVVLDASRSHHPAGIRAMNFKWWIDGGKMVIKNGPVTSTTLPRGKHTVVLIAEDRFGYVSRDTMIVRVR